MNETILTWLIFILAFGGMVLIHEFGHFIVARLCKIEVEEFGIGLPTPGAVTLFTWQGTRFTLNWLPLGGFVRPKGENDPNVPGGLAAASPWKRLAVLVAGPLMNLITAVIVFSIIISQSGGIITSQPENSGPTRLLVTSVVPGSPAEAGGFKVGDTIVRGAGRPIESQEDLRLVVEQNVDKAVPFVVERNGEQVELTATPLMNKQEQRPMIGVSFCTGCVFAPVNTVAENISYSLRYTGSQIRALVTLPVKLIRGTAAPEEGRLIGLKGIFDIMRQSVSNDVEASQAPSTPTAASGPLDKPVQTLFLIASLSISLGLFNLFPFPALDGGRIIFVLPELIFRRRVSPQLENLVHGMGMAFLLLLMIYINVMDFINPISVTVP
jgi:regulator of sigma E protease